MKNLILILVVILSFSCQKAQIPQEVPEDKYQIEQTTKALLQLDSCHALNSEYSEMLDKQSAIIDILRKEKNPPVNAAKYLHTIDSLKSVNNKLGKELLHDKQVIQNAKYYLNIANKNPSQQKFLRGWMNRALNQ